MNNGYCNDETNIPECNFDGGDCCGSCIITDYCTNCTCIGNVIVNGVPNALVGDGFCNDEINNANCSYDGWDCCPTSNLLGDGFCNDETNIPECMYDHGDCCLSNVNTDHCSECACSGNGIITTPGFPQNYANNLDLNWLIQLPPWQLIEIVFVIFETESG